MNQFQSMSLNLVHQASIGKNHVFTSKPKLNRYNMWKVDSLRLSIACVGCDFLGQKGMGSKKSME